jgi:hypothetical protein
MARVELTARSKPALFMQAIGNAKSEIITSRHRTKNKSAKMHVKENKKKKERKKAIPPNSTLTMV